MILDSIISGFASRGRATLMLLAVILVYGLFAFLTIPKESNPDIKIPMVYVHVHNQGISPDDAERILLRVLENSLKKISGIKEMTSYAEQDGASIVLEFDTSFDSDKAVSAVREKIDDVAYKLPKSADKPTVTEINLALMPVLNVVLMGDIPPAALLKFARELRDKVESISSVLKVDISGDKKDSVEIIIEPKVLESYKLSLQDLRNFINSSNVLVAAGSIDNITGQYSVKVPGLIEELDDLLQLPVKVMGHNVIRLRDIASVRGGFKDAVTIARVNGQPAVVLEVAKRMGYNLISTVSEVKKAVVEEQKRWPPNMSIIYAQDQSTGIKDMLADLQNNILLGIWLVTIVILMAMGWRSALIVAISIPVSFLAGILVLSLMHLTLNVVVLFSLILTVGMVVDDAIVVSEYADRKMLEGIAVKRSFIMAAKRMKWPIITSTVVKLVVFMPLLFWPGIVGQFMRFMPITVIAILTSSLVFALFFQPIIGPQIAKGHKIDAEEAKAVLASENSRFEDLRGFSLSYYRLLVRVLTRPKLFVGGVFATLVVVYIFFIVAGTGVEFFPKVEPENAAIQVETRGNLSLLEKDAIMRQIEERIAGMRGELRVVYVRSGQQERGQGDTSHDVIGIIQLEFAEWSKRRKAAVILEEIRQKVKDISGVVIKIGEQEEGPGGGKPIQINFSAEGFDKANMLVDKLLQASRAGEIKGLKDIDDSRSASSIEWEVVVDNALASRYGVNVETIGSAIQLVSNGLTVTKYRPDTADDEVDIVLRFPEHYRNVSSLDDIKIVTAEGHVVPISNFTKRVAVPGVGTLKRVDRKRVITIQSNVDAGVLVSDKVKELVAWLGKNNQDNKVQYNFKGESEDSAEAGQFLMTAFVSALLMMFMIMLIQFNSIYHTLIIMSAVFLSTVGILIGLILMWQPFGIVMCGVGVIALAGIVLNNNIIFIDTYQHLRYQGMAVREAILNAGVQRMRPILLTALTAVLGLLPMVFGLTINFFSREITYDAPASQWWRQLSTSIAGGLTFATILTLFFTPCLLLIGQRFDRDYNNKKQE